VIWFNAENAFISDILRIDSGITAPTHWEGARENRGTETVANGPCSGIGANISRQNRTGPRQIWKKKELVGLDVIGVEIHFFA